MATLTVQPRLDRPNTFGLVPVNIRIREGKMQVYYKISSVMIDPFKWDSVTCGVYKTHDNAVLINQKIKSDLIKVQQALLKLEIEGHGFNREMLKNRLTGYDDTNVYEFWERTLQQRKSNLSSESIRVYMSDLRKLKEFRKSLSFNEITLEFLESLEAWCRAKGNKDNNL